MFAQTALGWTYPSASTVALCDELADARPVITPSWNRWYNQLRENAHLMRRIGLDYGE